MVVRPAGNQLEVHAPAKLNLHLEILARRTDGFHEIETLMVPVSLYDTLQFTPNSNPELTLHCRWAEGLRIRYGDSLGDLPKAENNTVHRALELLRQSAGITQGAEVRIVKRIPSQAGLGGASSDAAAALLAANVGWKLHWSCEQLAQVAAQIGSDIPFFFHSGAAICRGRGEIIEPLERIHPLWVVLVRPPVGLSTPAVYRACRVPAEAVKVEPLLAALHRGNTFKVSELLMNRLQEPAEELSPAVVHLKNAFSQTDCLGHQMSGSGTSYFGICHNARHARRVAGQLAASNLGLVTWGAAGAA